MSREAISALKLCWIISQYFCFIFTFYAVVSGHIIFLVAAKKANVSTEIFGFRLGILVCNFLFRFYFQIMREQSTPTTCSFAGTITWDSCFYGGRFSLVLVGWFSHSGLIEIWVNGCKHNLAFGIVLQFFGSRRHGLSDCLPANNYGWRWRWYWLLLLAMVCNFNLYFFGLKNIVPLDNCGREWCNMT